MREFKKNANDMVKLRYQVWCAVTQDRIIVTAVITDVHAGVHKQPRATECFNTYFCDAIVWKADSSSGSTKYWALGAECDGMPVCDTLAIRNGNVTRASDMLPCDEPCLSGKVVRSDFF